MNTTATGPQGAPATQRGRATLAGKTFWSAAAGLVGVVSGLACSVLIARLLGVVGTGQVAYLVWLSEIGGLVASLGLGQALTRYLAELEGRDRADRSRALTAWIARRYLLLAVAGTALIALFGRSLVRESFDRIVWSALGLLLLIRGLDALYRAHLAGAQRFAFLARLNLATSALKIAGVGIGAWQWGVAGALGGYVAGSALPALLSLELLRAAGAPPAPPLRRRVTRYALHTWLAALLSAFVWTRLEIFFLERYRDASEVAMFTIGLTMASLATTGPLLLSGAMIPHFAERVGANDQAAVRAGYAAATRVLALLVFPACFGMAAIVPVLLPALYGSAFSGAVPNAIVLVAVSALAFSHVGSSLIYGMERSGFMALAGTAIAVLAVVVFSLVIPVSGSWGAVWARAALQLLSVVWGHVYIVRRLGCPVPLRALGRTLLAALACAAAAYAPIALWPRPWTLALAIPLGAMVYLIGLRVLGALVAEDTQRLRVHAQRLPGRLCAPTIGLLDWLEAKR